MSSTPKSKREPISQYGGRWLHHLLFAVFVAQCVLILATMWLAKSVWGDARVEERVLVLLATATTLGTLSRELPWQNVLFASAIIAGISSASLGFATLTRAPTGHLSHINWLVPFVWVVAILNARGMAQLLLHRWRPSPNYGLWLIALAGILAALFGLGFVNFEAFLSDNWSPKDQPLTLPITGNASVFSLLCWGMISVLAISIATPWLIDKRPVRRPPDRQPLITWLLLNAVFISAFCLRRLWLGVAIVGLCNILIVFLATARNCCAARYSL